MTKKKSIIALHSPYFQAGKSTTAGIIKNYFIYLNKKAEVLSVATPIKLMTKSLLEYLNINYEKYKNNKYIQLDKINNNSIRDILIWIGQSAKLEFNNTFWFDILNNKILESDSEIIIIDDLRFPEEYDKFDLNYKNGIYNHLYKIKIYNLDREIIKTETEGLLEGKKFDLELLNRKNDIESYQLQVIRNLQNFNFN